MTEEASQVTNESSTPRKTKLRIAESFKNGLAGIASEALFILLPLFVLAIVQLNRGKSVHDLLALSEWSFAASVMIGQGIVKFVSGVSARNQVLQFAWEWIALVVSALIVLGLVPSLIILSLLLTTETPSTTLLVLQFILFIIGLAIFMLFGATGQSFLSEKFKAKRAQTSTPPAT